MTRTRTITVEVTVRDCARCGGEVRRWREMRRNGERVPLGIDCGCYREWLQSRELWEFEVTGVVKR